MARNKRDMLQLKNFRIKCKNLDSGISTYKNYYANSDALAIYIPKNAILQNTIKQTLSLKCFMIGKNL